MSISYDYLEIFEIYDYIYIYIQSMKDVMTEIDENQYQESESESNDIITPDDDEKND